MGRYVTPQLTTSNLTADFADSASTKDVDGYLTEYVANEVTYTNITYATNSGGGADFGGTYRQVTGWTETNNVNNSTQNITVNYAGDGSVSSLTIT